LVLAALVLAMFIALVALAVDIGVMTMALGQLKTAADAAALAGAMQLVSDNRLNPAYIPSVEASNAASKALAIGQANIVLNRAAMILSSDVVVGSKPTNPPDPVDQFFRAEISPNTNSVQVTASRDSSHGGVVPAFFSRMWGSNGSSAGVACTATVELFSVSGFTPGTTNSTLFPIALSQSDYNNIIINKVDNYSYSDTGAPFGTVTSGPDGVYETSLYPDNSGPGNSGTINVGVSNNSTKVLGDQIQYGITPAQIAAAGDITAPTTFSGNPGISDGIKDNLTAIIGKSVVIPIYSSVSGNGNNLTYNIVAYQPFRIMDVQMTGNPKFLIIQPALSTDPTATPGTPTPWQQGGLVRLHLSR
jgi:hypothetical protein